MSHIKSIGAGLYSDLSVHFGADVTADIALPASPDAMAGWAALFGTEGAPGAATFSRITNVRTYPSFGTPANIVKVPVFGAKTSQQVQGQADAPNLEVTLNYIPSLWAAGTVLGDAVQDGVVHAFRFTLANASPADYSSTAASGLGQIGNSQMFWLGKIEALLVNPQLTDANTATLTLSAQSEFYGMFTTAAI